MTARSIQFMQPDIGVCPSTIEDKYPPYKVIGLIGTGYSHQIISMTSLLANFKIPVIGTLTTSDEVM